MAPDRDASPEEVPPETTTAPPGSNGNLPSSPTTSGGVRRDPIESAVDLRPEDFAVDGHPAGALHTYLDAAGTVIAVKARFEAGSLNPDRKEFRWFRPDGGAWHQGLNGRAVSIYNLPEVQEAISTGATVYFVEGEKCADVLSARGLVATTTPHGAGDWKPEYADQLADAHLVLLADNDDRGQRHVRDVGQALRGVAASVKVLDLPGLGPSGDVADWLAAGHDGQELVALASQARELVAHLSVADDWEEPTPLGCSSEPDPFPADSGAPSLIRDLAMESAHSIKVDPAAPFLLTEVVVSAAAGNGFSVRVSNAHAEPNLSRYGGWSADSGERKSAAFRTLAEPLDAWMRRQAPVVKEARKEAVARATYYLSKAQAAERKAAKAKSEDQEQELLAVADAAREKVPHPPRRPIAYIGDTTPEALVRHMAENGGASAVMSADARQTVDSLLGRHRSDGSTDDSVYLRAHGGDRIDRARVGNTLQGEFVAIDRPALAMGICIQPDKLRALASRPELLESGFLARCNLIQPRSLVGERIETGGERPIDAELASEWREVVGAIMDFRFRLIDAPESGEFVPTELVLDRDAMELRRAFANEIEIRQRPGGDLHGAGGLASKVAGEAARLAGLYHLVIAAQSGELYAVSERPIPASTWAMAEVAQRARLAETLRVLNLAVESEDVRRARRVLVWVSQDPGARKILTTRDLLSMRVVPDKAAAEQLLDWIEERGWVRKIDKPQGKRAPRWAVHPLALQGASQ